MGLHLDGLTEPSLAGDSLDESVDSITTFERHYSIHDISVRWGLSEKTVRRLFENEAGVIELANAETSFKRA
jgi:AraC-like DNA-binding protein